MLPNFEVSSSVIELKIWNFKLYIIDYDLVSIFSMYSLNKCGHWRQNRKLSKIHCYQTSLSFSEDWKEMKVVSKDILDPNRRERRCMILWIMYFHLWHVNQISSDTSIYWNYLTLITNNLITNISMTPL